MSAYCTRCGKAVAATARFCGACGHGLKSKMEPDSAGRATRHDRHGPPRVEQRGSPVGVDAYKALISEKSLRRMKALGSVVIAAVLGVTAYQTHERSGEVIFGGLALCTLVAFIAAIWFYTPERLSQDEYQALPGAVTERGHQCVFCGWRGIHRYTPYKTNTTMADCAQCKAELWFE